MTKLSIVIGAGVVALTTQARADDTCPASDCPPPAPPVASANCPAPAATTTPVENCPPAQPAPTATVQPQPQPTYQPATYETAQPDMYSYAWSEPLLQSGIGISVTLGGGVTGFTSSDMRDVSSNSVGGLWDLRIGIGTHIPLGIEVNYTGSATSLETFSGFNNGTLIGSAVEGVLKWNILPHFEVNPYIFAGVGWQNYSVTSNNFSTAASGMESSTNVADFPMGVGVSYRDVSGLVADLRGTFRWTTSSDLLTAPGGGHADLWNWTASAAIGYEF